MKAYVDRLGWLVAMGLAGVTVMGLIELAEFYRRQDPPDAVSRATYPAEADVTLPPRGETYKLIGRQVGFLNFVVRYDDRLYRGGQLVSDGGIKTLRKWGVRTILSVTPDDSERKYVAAAGLKLVELPLDKQKPVPKQTLRKFLDTIEAERGRFYLHSLSGCRRAGALAAAYRIHVGGWEFDKAVFEFGRLGGCLKDDHKLLESIRKP